MKQHTTQIELIPIARDIVIDHIPQFVVVIDARDLIIDANEVAEHWAGLPKAEMIGKDPLHIFTKWSQFLNRLLVTEETREEVTLAGEPTRIVELMVIPIKNKSDGTLSGRVVVAHDITERKQSENDLTDMNEILWGKIEEVELLRAQLQEQAIRDPLTGLFNRRFFSESLEKETAQALRDNSTLSIIILDIDHFKQVNDQYGHKLGDLALQQLAKLLTDNIRSGDIACRFGGEEFVILMPNATTESAFERAEFLRKQFEGMIIKFENKKLTCTFSAGVASFPTHADSGESVLNLADTALYQSKSNGRNKVTIFK
ncbi:MAG: diguanylate cyclase [Chloroflexi bacterium OLB14]|nr:MAG: diguanylate cyclase [Chloroflexi bacterium OLB14]